MTGIDNQVVMFLVVKMRVKLSLRNDRLDRRL